MPFDSVFAAGAQSPSAGALSLLNLHPADFVSQAEFHIQVVFSA